MGVKLITAPTDTPVSLAEIKAELRIDHSDDDTMLTRHLFAAAEYIEELIERKLMTQTWEFHIDEFPSDEIGLPFGPVQSIESVKYDDAAGVEQTVSASDYFLDNVSRNPWLFPSVGWPTPLDAVNSVRVRLVAGYATAADVPRPIKQAVALKVQELYDGADRKAEIERLCWSYLPMLV